MGAILLTVLTALLGFWLGRGVPRLVQRSGSLARRNQASQLAFASVLLLPWLLGIALVVLIPLRPQLLLPAIGYAVGMWRGRRRAGL
jgi:protein-S-isoprenylcysteine O-methyltransferase Ste14